MSTTEPRRWPRVATHLALAAALLVACGQPSPPPAAGAASGPAMAPTPPAGGGASDPVALASPEARRPAGRPPVALPANPHPGRRLAAQPAPADQLHLVRRAGRVDGPLPYLVIEPAEAPRDLPLLIALHGRGSTARQFADLMEELRLPVRVIVASAPLPWGRRDGKQWFELGAPDGPAQVLARVEELGVLVDHLEQTFPGAPPPLLLGFSQGAMLTLQALARSPSRYLGGIALSGKLPVATGNTRAEGSQPAGLPTVLVTAGRGDTVIAPASSAEAAEALRALGHEVEFMEFSGAHNVPAAVRERVRSFLAALLAAR